MRDIFVRYLPDGNHKLAWVVVKRGTVKTYQMAFLRGLSDKQLNIALRKLSDQYNSNQLGAIEKESIKKDFEVVIDEYTRRVTRVNEIDIKSIYDID